MIDFHCTCIVQAETREQALQVLAERLDHDEDYGFPYAISHSVPVGIKIELED